MKVSRITATTAMLDMIAPRWTERGVAMADHSSDRRTPPTEIMIKNGARHRGAGQSNTHTAVSAPVARITPDVARAAKFFQSKGLARGKNVIDGDAAISSLPGLEFVDRGQEVRRAVVRPIDILEHHFGVGAFPQEEV